MPCNARYEWCKNHKADYAIGGKEYCVFHAPKDKKGISKALTKIIIPLQTVFFALALRNRFRR